MVMLTHQAHTGIIKPRFLKHCQEWHGMAHLRILYNEPGVLAHAWNPSVCDAEAEARMEFGARLGYRVISRLTWVQSETSEKKNLNDGNS